MSFIVSPNMFLPVPTVGQEPGPDYAIDVNNALTLIDQHDHSPGRGVLITTSGININTNFSFNGFSLIDAGSIVLVPQLSASTTPQSLSAAPGGEGPPQQDLWYTPDTGVPIQITKNGIVNSTASSIPGESYAAGTFFWTQTQDGFPNRPANFDIGSITLRPNINLTTNGVILGPPSAIASQYNINLPLLPSVTSFMAIDNSGNITTPASTASIIPSNPGTAGQFLRQSAGGTPLYQYPNANIQVKTSTYTAIAADDVILCSSGNFSINLPTAVGITGKTLIIKKTDDVLGNVITIAPNGGQTIDGYSTYRLKTLNETLEIVSDGANWKIIDHKTNTDVLDTGEAITVTATTTSPTKGTVVFDRMTWQRQGRNAIINYAFEQSAGGSAGSGDYLLTIPAGMQIDNTSIPAYTGSVGSSLTSIQAAYPSSIDLSASAMLTGTTSIIVTEATAYSDTQFRISTFNIAGPSFNNFGSGGTTFAAVLCFNFTITVPIVDWKP